MLQDLKESLWNQFGASTDMLINVIRNCTDDYLIAHKRFYYIAFHSVIFLDYYSTVPPQDFQPRLSFTPTEKSARPKEAVDDLIPDKFYTVQQLVDYLIDTRKKCELLIKSLSAEKLQQRFIEGTGDGDMNFSILEILLYNMRHTQHHAAQLNMLIRQDENRHMEWSFRAGDIKID